MPEPVVITVLIENSVHARGLLAEHGLALHLQVGKRSLLFDTGQSDLLLGNARLLRVRLAETEAVVLSHGHNDHTGGMDAVRQIAPKARFFLHPDALHPKLARNPDGTSRSLGMKQTSSDALQSAPELVVRTTSPTEVLDGIFVTGEIARLNAFEDAGGAFFRDAACTEPDPMLDDQAIFFKTPGGMVVLFGCAHAGVINTLEYVQRLTGSKPIHTIMGGLHLQTASPERMDRTLAAFRRWDLRQLALGHCTGMRAMARLWTTFPDRCSGCSVGVKMQFQR